MVDARRRDVDALVANVLEAAGALRRHGDEQASRLGQTQARWQVLSVLSGEPLTVPAAARRLGVSRQAVQRIVDVLRREALVHARANPAHAGSPLLSLTPVGEEVLGALTEENAPWNRRAETELDGDDVATANRVLRRLITLSRG